METFRPAEERSEKSSVAERLMIGTLKFISSSYQFIFSLFSNPNPLFSVIISFYFLIFLYLPHVFLSFVLSPVFISTAVLLITLLRFGSYRQEEDDPISRNGSCLKSEADPPLCEPPEDEMERTDPEKEAAKWIVAKISISRSTDFSGKFMRWDRSGPLEVIYEEQDGEEEGESPANAPQKDRKEVGIDAVHCSSLSYADSDSSEGELPAWDSPENLCFRWDESEDLIEIPLTLKPPIQFESEEDNLIEINIGSCRR